ENRAVLLQEVEQVRHLLEIGGHVRVVPREVDIVEDEVDDVLDAVSEVTRRRPIRVLRATRTRDLHGDERCESGGDEYHQGCPLLHSIPPLGRGTCTPQSAGGASPPRAATWASPW